jgi:isochorismate pyruvate lyase
MDELAISPDDCADMDEIRAEVNKIDRGIIALLGKRLAYVRSAVAFKPDEDSIRRPDHWDSFFAARKRWAAEEGYDPEVIEAMYRILYDFTIETQLSLHARKQPRA